MTEAPRDFATELLESLVELTRTMLWQFGTPPDEALVEMEGSITRSLRQHLDMCEGRALILARLTIDRTLALAGDSRHRSRARRTILAAAWDGLGPVALN